MAIHQRHARKRSDGESGVLMLSLKNSIDGKSHLLIG